MVNDDFNRMGKMDEAIERIENSNEIICESLFALLNHEITGNSVDKLIKQRDNLKKYLILSVKIYQLICQQSKFYLHIKY